VPEITSALREMSDWQSQLHTIRLLGEIGPEAKLSVPLLKEFATNSMQIVASYARVAIRQISPQDTVDYPVRPFIPPTPPKAP
jgi:hypothetical protein